MLEMGLSLGLSCPRVGLEAGDETGEGVGDGRGLMLLYSLPPPGLYRNNLLQQFLEAWYNQKFLGTHCTFGDDRHLTNRMLSMGYATK